MKNKKIGLVVCITLTLFMISLIIAETYVDSSSSEFQVDSENSASLNNNLYTSLNWVSVVIPIIIIIGLACLVYYLMQKKKSKKKKR